MVVFAGRRRAADARVRVGRWRGTTASRGEAVRPNWCANYFLRSTCEFGSKIISTSERGTAYERLPPHKQPDLVSDLFTWARP